MVITLLDNYCMNLLLEHIVLSFQTFCRRDDPAAAAAVDLAALSQGRGADAGDPLRAPGEPRVGRAGLLGRHHALRPTGMRIFSAVVKNDLIFAQHGGSMSKKKELPGPIQLDIKITASDSP